jgi:tRNA U55 pseudouridine synthase TruB
LDVRVSSGTYIRSLAIALGGHCASLRRTEVGPFSVEEAVAPEAFAADRLIAGATLLERVEAARAAAGP